MSDDPFPGAVSAPELVWRVPLRPAPQGARQVTAALAADERTIAWWSDWESGPAVNILDVATGRALHREVCAVLRVLPSCGGRLLAVDQGYRQRDLPRRTVRLVAFDRVRDRVAVRTREVSPRTILVGADPAADRFVLFADGRCELRSWAGRDASATWRWSAPGVDWEAGCVWGVPAGNEVVLNALDGSWDRSITPSRWTRVHGVGDGAIPHAWLAALGALLTVRTDGAATYLELWRSPAWRGARRHSI